MIGLLYFKDSSQSVTNTESSLESKDLKRPIEELADGDSENSPVQGLYIISNVYYILHIVH